MRSTRTALLTRRQFLRRLGIATGVTLGLGPLRDLRALAQPAQPVHVVIVGAGLAGLCAAFELERRGHTYAILEAETAHVGGRVRTLRFEGGLHGEAGAMRVPKGHALTRHYVAELGLSLRPFVQSTWYPADNAVARDPKVSASPAVLLASYSWGQTARRLATLSHTERSGLALTHLARVHPQLARAGEVRRTASWSWDNHRWSGGAFAWFMPGQWSALHRHVVAPEGRIYFAGEHGSLTHTWMQGALESALVAVREMLAEAGRS
jgi:monoamine oxidase